MTVSMWQSPELLSRILVDYFRAVKFCHRQLEAQDPTPGLNAGLPLASCTALDKRLRLSTP